MPNETKTPTKKPGSWSVARRHLSSWDMPALLALVKDLHNASPANRDFIQARCQADKGGGELLEAYRSKIVEQFSPKRKPMSAILKEMALTTLVAPEAVPSTEAASAALLLSHVAWQRANGELFPDRAYAAALAMMQRAKPDFWKEMRSTDTRTTIAELVAYKTRHYPDDKRQVTVCCTQDSKVRVEWTE